MANWETKARSKLKVGMADKGDGFERQEGINVPDSLCLRRMEREASQMTSLSMSGSKNGTL